MEASAKAAKRIYRSAASVAIHETAEGLHKSGMIDHRTREFDQECLTPIIELSPEAIRKIRTEAAISQAVFAAHLNVTTGVVSKGNGARSSQADRLPSYFPLQPGAGLLRLREGLGSG
ncbi:MAG: hypothetical protein WBQ94_28345, partial [Terracidiphilus sp.]